MYGNDEVIGKSVLFVVFLFFSYYFIWAAVLPFAVDHSLQWFFPNSSFAIFASAFVFTFILTLTGGYLCYSFLKC